MVLPCLSDTLKRLEEILRMDEVSFKQLTPEWLSQFERKLLSDQLKWEFISTYMRDAEICL